MIFDSYFPIPDPNAVSPLSFLTADARVVFDRIWQTAAYEQELVEPFSSNPRSASFPLTRTWRRESGTGPAGFSFTRTSARSAAYEYAILAESGTAVEAGAVTLRSTARPQTTIDFVSPTATRLAIYDIIDGSLRLAISPPGSARPTSFSDVSVYRTERSTLVP